MDDRELEARLSGHLHERFDNAPVPARPAAAVREGMAPVAANRVAFRLGGRAFQLGWATVAVVLVVGAVLLFQNTLGPASPRPTSTPVATAAAPRDRWFVVLPAEVTLSKDEAIRATDVLSARMRALGYGTFTTFGGFGIGFEMVPDSSSSQPSDDATRRVLTATGDVRIVPLPSADYGNGGLEAVAGKPLPKDEPALFGWEGIESFAFGTDQESRMTLEMTLKPAARQAFAEYTAGHVMEGMAIVIDGLVAVAPIINEPITGGQVAISSGAQQGSAAEQQFLEWSATLIGGMLPESWQGASSPKLLTEEQAIARAQALYPTGSVEATQVYFSMHGSQAAAIWQVRFSGTFPQPCQQDPCPSPWTYGQVDMEAVTGEILMGPARPS